MLPVTAPATPPLLHAPPCPPQGIAMPRFVFMAAQSEGRHYSLSNLDQRMASIYL